MNILVAHRHGGQLRWATLAQPDLWRYLLRTVALGPIVAAGAVSMLVALGGFRTSLEQTLAAAFVAIGTSLVLDDPAAAVTASSPSPWWLRRASRLALALPSVTAMWLAVRLSADALGRVWPPLDLEVATLTLMVLAFGAVTIRLSGDGRAAPTAPALVLLTTLSARMPLGRWAIYPVAGHEARWGIMAVVAVVVGIVATRDPATTVPMWTAVRAPVVARLPGGRRR